MNEHIRKCCDGAGLDSNWKPGFNSIYGQQLEKFAELIVRECINLAQFCVCIDGSRDPDDYTQGCHDAIHITIERMASEFGVRL